MRNQKMGAATRKAEKHMVSNNSKKMVEALSQTTIYHDYERAFTDATGLPLALSSLESWGLPHHTRRKENPFCAMMASSSRSCAACLRVQQDLCESAKTEAKSVNCPLGLTDTAVPVRLGESVIGYLHTGQVFRKKPSDSQFNRALETIKSWGMELDGDKLREAYFAGKVVNQKEHDAVVRLLSIFGEHLSAICNQILIKTENAEPPVITRAKKYIEDNHSEDLSLSDVAKAVNTSAFYFCKLFKKSTGINFTEHVSRVRIERAKNLLLNPNLRVSEIAYEVGFQSLTHFNRVFKKISGQSPTDYRSKLTRAQAGA